METLLVLPNPVTEISPQALSFLDAHFTSHQDLSRAPSLSTELKKDCGDLDRAITTLQRNLSSLITEWVSRSNSVKTVFRQLNGKFRNLCFYPSPDGIGKVDMKKMLKILGEELPMLAKEMRRIELVRFYAETTLHLEALVGDLEDAVLCVLNQNMRNIISVNLPKASVLTNFKWKQDKLLLAVKAMNDIEEVLVKVAENQPTWCRLLKSVDARVDKAFSLLRMQALADHRTVLASLGWPPLLLTSEPEGVTGSELPNPLILMQGDKKERYSQSFLALCALQHLQAWRSGRKLEHEKDQRLWTFDELVSPIASKTEHHFSKWIDEPKYMFALIYRITRDVVVGVDDVLQPLVDKVRLVGYSAKEAWVSAMAEILSAYLTKRIFSDLATRYREKNEKVEVIFSWLRLVDLIITFDKRMQSLAGLGIADTVGESVGFDRFSKGISVLSIFCDHPDWLRIWAKIELKDGYKKLKEESDDERSWMINYKIDVNPKIGAEAFILSSREDHKAPVIAEAVVKITQTMMQRCQTLPSILLRAQFIRSSAAKFLWYFFNILLQRCQETELMLGYAEDAALLRLCGSVNAARYCESVLREWSENVDFLEMRIAEDNSGADVRNDLDDHCCFFWDEVKCLMKIETDWIAEIMTDLLRQFDTLSWKYIQNMETWSSQDESYGGNIVSGGDLVVSPDFVETLDALKNRLQVLNKALNLKDFLDLWRSVAEGLDHFIFSSIITSGARFSNRKVGQFSTDMQALFLIFQSFCARPEAFFPCIKDSFKLLEMDSGAVKHLVSDLSKVGKRTNHLRLRGILNISPDQAEKILRSRS